MQPCDDDERGVSEKNDRLDVDIPGEKRGQPNLRWKDVCKRGMTEAGLGTMEEE